MSKNVKKTRKPLSPVITLPLNSGDIEAHMKACEKITRSYIADALITYLNLFLDEIMTEVDNAISNQESNEWLMIHHLVKSKDKEIKHHFCAYMLNVFKDFNVSEEDSSSLTGSVLSFDSSSASIKNYSNLRLVDKHTTEENVIISEIVRHINTKTSEALWMLNRRFSALKSGKYIEDKDNPVAPIQFCHALQEALVILPPKFNVKKLAYSSFAKVLLPLSFKLLESINSYLQRQGILPNMTNGYGERSDAPVAAPRNTSLKNTTNDEDKSDVVTKDINQVHAEREQELIKKITLIQNNRVNTNSIIENKAVEIKNSGDVDHIASTEFLVEVLQSLHVDKKDLVRALLRWNAQPILMPDASAYNLVKKVRESTRSGKIKNDDMHVINLVGMLFDYMLNDEDLPVSVKALLSYLHVPFLKIAFIDRDFFEQSTHPARLLLNSLTEAGGRWVNDDGSADFDMFNRIKDVVIKIHEAKESEVKLVTALLLDFRSHIKHIQRKQDLTEKRAKEKARGEDRLREAKSRVNTEISSRIKDKELPSSVLLFLLQPWTDYLTFIYLQHGEKSESWEAALVLVDELIWCSSPKETLQEQERLVETHYLLLSDIANGLAYINFPESKKDNLISAISSVIELSSKQEETKPASLPVRIELESKAAEQAAEQAVENDVVDEPTKEEVQMTEKLKLIEFGTWLEFDGSKRLKISWSNSRTGEYMLVNQMGQRAEMMLPLTLARLMLAGKVKLLSGSSKPFFERALENIYEKLNSSS